MESTILNEKWWEMSKTWLHRGSPETKSEVITDLPQSMASLMLLKTFLTIVARQAVPNGDSSVAAFTKHTSVQRPACTKFSTANSVIKSLDDSTAIAMGFQHCQNS
jgi:hypothetical protein